MSDRAATERAPWRRRVAVTTLLSLALLAPAGASYAFWSVSTVVPVAVVVRPLLGVAPARDAQSAPHRVHGPEDAARPGPTSATCRRVRSTC